MPFKNIEDKRAWAKRYARQWRNKNIARALEKERQSGRKRQTENPEQVRAWRRDFYHRHKARLKEERAPYFAARKPIKKLYDQKRLREQWPKRQMQVRSWILRNRPQVNAYWRNKRVTDPQFRVSNNLRCRMNSALSKAGKKRDRPLEVLIGCTVKALMAHLEARFKPGMSWRNRPKWHIDHIKPCKKFDLTDRAEQLRCFHFTNLQPLWPVENVRKGGR